MDITFLLIIVLFAIVCFWLVDQISIFAPYGAVLKAVIAIAALIAVLVRSPFMHL